ncbi:MAG TPA: phage tail tube protein [Azospirillum sp.]
MTIASGVFKELRIKKETTWGVAAGSSGGQILRRVSSDLDLRKNTYQSQEIAAHQQVDDFRHGTRRVEGNINGELSPGTYELPLAALLRKGWTAGATFTSGVGSEVTVTGTHTVHRAGGSWLADGFKVGDIVRAAGSVTAANNARNLRVTAITAADLTVAETLTNVGSGETGVTIAVPGKKLWVPTSGHTRDSFTIEHWYSDIGKSEQFLGCVPTSANLQLPATGIATIQSAWMGKDMQTGDAAYFGSPADASTTGLTAAVNGSLRLGGSDIATVTGLTITITGGHTTGETVGSNTTPDVFPGRVVVSGQFTCYFEDDTVRGYFIDESEVELLVKLDVGSAADTDFLAIHMGRLKVGGANKDDGEKGLIQTVPFQALLRGTGGAGTAYEKTTISIIDSTL